MARNNVKALYGENDLENAARVKVGNTWLLDPIYDLWRGVVRRSCSEIFKRKAPTYLESEISDEWLKYSNFRSWVETQKWEGLELDKDILIKGNKLYSAETCCFVPQYLNTLLYVRTSEKSSNLPMGVTKHSGSNKYIARVGLIDSRKYLGIFENPLDAHRAYQKAKSEHIEQMILKYMQEPCYRQDVANALSERALYIRQDMDLGRLTYQL